MENKPRSCIMRKPILVLTIVLLAGMFMSDGALAAQPVSGSSTAGTAAPGGTAKAGVQRGATVNGRRSGKNMRHFRHKNRSMEPADDNTGAIPNKTPAHGNTG